MACLNVPDTSVSFTTSHASFHPYFISHRYIYQIFYEHLHILVFMQFCPLVLLCVLDSSLQHTDFTSVNVFSVSSICKKQEYFSIFEYRCQCSPLREQYTDAFGAIQHKNSSETAIGHGMVCCVVEYLRLNFFTVRILYCFLFFPNSSLFNSRQTQGALNDSDDPETGCLSDNKPTSRHFYPVALLLVSSHLLVVWLILSLALLLAKYQ